MFHLTVRDHIMIAHSLPDPSFGPAQQLHGATYVVELQLWRHDLTAQGTVIDIGELSTILADELADLRYRNLDEHPDLAGHYDHHGGGCPPRGRAGGSAGGSAAASLGST